MPGRARFFTIREYKPGAEKMTQPVTLKAYGNIYPATENLRDALGKLCALAIPPASCQAKDGMLLISFEGVYFPTQEILAAIEAALDKTQRGKLDVLDIEGWVLERYIFANGAITSKRAPLNNVLDYSGH